MALDLGIAGHYELWCDDVLDQMAQESFEEEMDGLLNETVPPEPHDSPVQNSPNAWNDDEVPW